MSYEFEYLKIDVQQCRTTIATLAHGRCNRLTRIFVNRRRDAALLDVLLRWVVDKEIAVAIEEKIYPVRSRAERAAVHGRAAIRERIERVRRILYDLRRL